MIKPFALGFGVASAAAICYLLARSQPPAEAELDQHPLAGYPPESDDGLLPWEYITIPAHVAAIASEDRLWLRVDAS